MWIKSSMWRLMILALRVDYGCSTPTHTTATTTTKTTIAHSYTQNLYYINWMGAHMQEREQIQNSINRKHTHKIIIHIDRMDTPNTLTKLKTWKWHKIHWQLNKYKRMISMWHNENNSFSIILNQYFSKNKKKTIA